jgi:purine-binding chemotaxis protein CheW
MNAAINPMGTAESAARKRGQYLTFFLGTEVYAVEILRIREIIEYGNGNITEVPTMPEFILGVVNLRGAVVPIVDLAARFGKKRCEPGRKTCILILEIEAHAEKQYLGIVVDSVSTVVKIPSEEIVAPPSFGANIRPEFISGMGKVNGKLAIILNVNSVLSVDEIATLAEVGDAQPAATATVEVAANAA